MNLIFLGPPGVGKGTQASHICDHYGIIHLSTGDILRSEIKISSEIGKTAKSYIDQGALVRLHPLLGRVERLRVDAAHDGDAARLAREELAVRADEGGGVGERRDEQQRHRAVLRRLEELRGGAGSG